MTLVLAGRAITPAPAVPASTRIFNKLKRAGNTVHSWVLALRFLPLEYFQGRCLAVLGFLYTERMPRTSV